MGVGNWLGKSGDINDPANYYGQGIDTGNLVKPIGDLLAYVLNTLHTGAVNSSSNVIFADPSVSFIHGPTPPASISDSAQNGQITTPFLAIPYVPSHPPQAPLPATFSLPGAGYTVSGNASVASITVATYASTVTFSGQLTIAASSAAPAPGSTGAPFIVEGPTVISGSVTDQYDAQVSGGLTVTGTAVFQGTSVDGLGHVGLIITYGDATIDTTGRVTTGGLYVGTPSSYAGNGNLGVRLDVLGTLKDTDRTTGIMVGSGTGAIGLLQVLGGQVNSVTATVGGATAGQGTVTINSTGTWTNTGTFNVGVAGTLTDGGVLAAGELSVAGSLSVDAGTLTLGQLASAGGQFNPITGGLDLISTGSQISHLSIKSGSVVTTQYLNTASASTTVIDSSSLTVADDTGFGPVTGLSLNGTVDLKNDTVTATAMQAAVLIGYADTSGSATYNAVATQTSGTIVANTTTIGSGANTTGTLTIVNGLWTDQGSGTTMTIGAGAGSGSLFLQGGATLTDQSVAIGTGAGPAAISVAGSADVTGGANWNIKSNLTVGGGGGVAQLSAEGQGKITVAGNLTVMTGGSGSSAVDINQGTLSVTGGNIAVSGSGSNLSVNGQVMAATGTVHVSGGQLSVSNSIPGGTGAGTLTAQALLVDGGGTVSLGFGFAAAAEATIDVVAQGATITGGSTLRIFDGVLQANTIVVSQNGTITGTGIIGNSSATAFVTATGGTLTATGTAGLVIRGTIVGGTDIVSGAAAMVTQSIQGGRVMFQGSGGYLAVVNGTSLGATVSGFVSGDTIDLGGVVANSATWSGNELFLYSNGVVTSQFALTGNYSATQFVVSNGGTVAAIAAITIGSGSPSPTPLPTTSAPPSPPGSYDFGSPNSLDLSSIQDSSATGLTVTVSDLGGTLGATASGSATVKTSRGLLVVSGSVADVNATLATATYTPGVPGEDVITENVVDNTGAALVQTVSFDVPNPGVTVDVPGTVSLVAGTATAVGIVLSDTLTEASLQYSVTLADTAGTLAATAAGAATLTQPSAGTLTITGDLGSIDRTLASLTETEATGSAAATSDSIVVTASDQFGGISTETVDLAITQPTPPTETDWATGNDGSASVAANWTAGVPTTALLTVAPGGDYTISGPIDAGKVEVEGAVNFTGSISAAGTAGDYQTFLVDGGGTPILAGGTLNTASLVIGATGSGEFTLDGGAQATLSGDGPVGQAEAAYLGFTAGAVGGLAVSDATLAASTGLSIGDDGNGSVSVANGGTISTGSAGSAGSGYADVVLGNNADGGGALSVDGAASKFSSAAPIVIGDAGSGALAVSNSGLAISAGPAGGASAIAGYAATAEGIVSVDGAGSTWDVTQTLVLGYDGTAYADVSGGGTLEVDGTLLRIGRDAGSSGELDLYGTGSTLSAPGAALSLGLDGSAVLYISASGAATVASVVIGANADASSQLEIDGSGSVLNVLGGFSDGAASGTLINVAGGTIATGSGFSIGNGSNDVATVNAGGAITGGITLGAAATLNIDETAVLGGTLTFTGGTLAYAASTQGDIGTIANQIVAADGGQGTLNALSSLDLSGGVAFRSGADILIGGMAVVTGAVTGFAAGDTLDLENFQNEAQLPDTAVWSNGTLSVEAVQYGGGAVFETLDLPGNYATTRFAVAPDANGTGADITITACYARGTRILTLRGEVPVEALCEGDLVSTLAGRAAPVVWLGHRHTDCTRHPRPSDVMPVRVRAGAFGEGAFGEGVPHRDLLLSPDHAVFAHGVLIPIRYLLNGSTIVQDACDEVTYWHVELDRHDVILAEGLPCESYLDTGNRGAFANGAMPVHLHPGFTRDAESAWVHRACGPLVEDGPILAGMRDQLASRAELLGCPVPHVLAIDLSEAGRVVQSVPAGVAIIRLTSPSAHRSGDRRRLGALVTGLRIDGASLGMDDARLGFGFHELEVHGVTPVRWTNGEATIAIGNATTERVIEIDVAVVQEAAGRQAA